MGAGNVERGAGNREQGTGKGEQERELINRTEDEEVLHHINIIDFILFV